MSEIQFKVIKETYTYRFCDTCKGAGWKKRRFQGHEMKEVCIMCKGSGKQKLTRRTEVSLEEALMDLQSKFAVTVNSEES